MADHSQTRPRPDDTPPRNSVIAVYTLMAVIALVALRFVFDSYMDLNRAHVRHENIASSRTSASLAEYREDQARRLASGALPIDRAIRDLGRGGLQPAEPPAVD
jgi:hypothetical protein